MNRGLVFLLSSGALLLMYSNKERVDVNNINEFLNSNLQQIVTIVWYGMVAAASFLTCTFSRTTLRTFLGELAGPTMAFISNVLLTIVISIHFGDVSWKSKNTPVEEMILCSVAGYYLYEMFFLRLADSLQDRFKALGAIAVGSFIIHSLRSSEGASVQLLLLFLLSSLIPNMKLPGFGSAGYVDSRAYKLSVWAAYICFTYRLIVGLGLQYRLWTDSKFQFFEYERPMYVTIYCNAVGIVLCGLEYIKKKEKENLMKKNEETDKIRKCEEHKPKNQTKQNEMKTSKNKEWKSIVASSNVYVDALDKKENGFVHKRKVAHAYDGGDTIENP